MKSPTTAALAKDPDAAQARVLGFLDSCGLRRIDTHASVVFLGMAGFDQTGP